MAKLRRPLHRDLRDVTPGDTTVEQMWMNVHNRLAPRPRAPALGWVFAAAAGAAAVVLAVVALRRPVVPGPLLLADGTPVVALSQPPTDGPREVSLNDRSHLVLDAGASLEPIENSGSRFDVQLRQGRVRFEVEPGGPRRWIIEAGPATVEVVGTGFAVERGAHAVDVEVFHGVVLVRGELVPAHVQRLTAGDRLHVEDAPPPVIHEQLPALVPPSPAPHPAPAHPHPAPQTPTAPAPAKEPHAVAPEATPWQALARTSKYQEAYAALGEKGTATIDLDRISVDELMTLADVARYSGHPQEAISVLTRISQRFPGDRNAGLASFTRGRIELDELSHPANAVEAFVQAQTLGLPAALQENAAARLVDARVAAHDMAGAQSALREYLARFPEGRDRARLQQLLEKK